MRPAPLPQAACRFQHLDPAGTQAGNRGRRQKRKPHPCRTNPAHPPDPLPAPLNAKAGTAGVTVPAFRLSVHHALTLNGGALEEASMRVKNPHSLAARQAFYAVRQAAGYTLAGNGCTCANKESPTRARLPAHHRPQRQGQTSNSGGRPRSAFRPRHRQDRPDHSHNMGSYALAPPLPPRSQTEEQKKKPD